MIITNDLEALRRQCVDCLPEEVDALIEALERELEASAARGSAGIGLAAPQIGIYKKAAIIRIPTSSEIIKINLINCRVEKGYDEVLIDYERCLSFTNIKEGKTKRWNEVYITGNAVKPYSFIATELVAITCAHEIDHFNQRILPDYLLK